MKWKKPSIKHMVETKWGWRVGHPEGLKLGKNVDIGCGCYINARYGVSIGDNVQIGGNTLIYSHNTINNTKGRVVIGSNARIGAHALILPGAVIKKGEFVKAYEIRK